MHVQLKLVVLATPQPVKASRNTHYHRLDELLHSLDAATPTVAGTNKPDSQTRDHRVGLVADTTTTSLRLEHRCREIDRRAATLLLPSLESVVIKSQML